MSFLKSTLIAMSATAVAAAALAAGESRAATSLSCTFGNTTGCNGAVGNATFDSFTPIGSGFESADTIIISLSGNTGLYSILLNSAPGTSSGFTGNGKLGFFANAIPGYFLDTVSLNPASVGTVTVKVNDSKLAGSLVSTGGPVSQSWLPNTDTADTLLEWSVAGGSEISTILYTFSTNPPSLPPAVPGPLPVAGAASAFAFTRRLRRRLANTSKATKR